MKTSTTAATQSPAGSTSLTYEAVVTWFTGEATKHQAKCTYEGKEIVLVDVLNAVKSRLELPTSNLERFTNLLNQLGDDKISRLMEILTDFEEVLPQKKGTPSIQSPEKAATTVIKEQLNEMKKIVNQLSSKENALKQGNSKIGSDLENLFKEIQEQAKAQSQANPYAEKLCSSTSPCERLLLRYPNLVTEPLQLALDLKENYFDKYLKTIVDWSKKDAKRMYPFKRTFALKDYEHFQRYLNSILEQLKRVGVNYETYKEMCYFCVTNLIKMYYYHETPAF